MPLTAHDWYTFSTRYIGYTTSDHWSQSIICPTVCSMGQIIKSVCVCQSVCQCVSLSVRLRALSRSHFLNDFRQNVHRRKNPQRKNEFIMGSISHHPPLFCLQNLILGQEVLKTHANIKWYYICLKCMQIAEIFVYLRNLGRGTRWWRQILDRKWKYGRFAHAQWKNMQYNPYLWLNCQNFQV